MSKLSDSPRPVPSPAGFVVKNGLKIFPHFRQNPGAVIAEADLKAIVARLRGGSHRWFETRFDAVSTISSSISGGGAAAWPLPALSVTSDVRPRRSDSRHRARPA
jgi:hypothetical protein